MFIWDQLMVVIGGLEFLRSPSERDCFLLVSLEFQTTNPNHQFTVN